MALKPAVNFCGGARQDTDPFDYLDEFFAACAASQSTIDALLGLRLPG